MISTRGKRNISLGFISLFFSSCMFTPKTTRRLLKEAESNGPYDMIVVPGVPLENGTWSRIMKGRIYWSKYLYEKGIAKNIMYSGGAVYSPYPEAKVMALYAEAIGIPKDIIFTETKAEHSTENIYYSYKKAKQLGFNRIALASDPFQSKLVKRFIRKKVSPDIALIPFIIDIMKIIEPTMIDPIINFDSIQVKDFKSLKEREGFWKRFRGTRGRNLDKKAYED